VQCESVGNGERDCKKLLVRRHLTLSIQIESAGRNLIIMSLTHFHSKLVVFALKNAINSEVRIAQSEMRLESAIVDVIVLFKFSEIVLKALSKMLKLLMPCSKISDLCGHGVLLKLRAIGRAKSNKTRT
jgi:hypothetical protein